MVHRATSTNKQTYKMAETSSKMIAKSEGHKELNSTINQWVLLQCLHMLGELFGAQRANSKAKESCGDHVTN